MSKTETTSAEPTYSERARVVQRTSKSFEPDEVLLIYDREVTDAWITAENPMEAEDR